MVSFESGKSFIIPKLKKKSVTSVKNLARDLVLKFPKASPLLPNRAKLEQKRIEWEKIKERIIFKSLEQQYLKQMRTRIDKEF